MLKTIDNLLSVVAIVTGWSDSLIQLERNKCQIICVMCCHLYGYNSGVGLSSV